MSFIDIVKNRRSIRSYLSKEVSDELLFRIIEVARWAPSAHNAQPWRFIVIKEHSVKVRLAKAVASRWDKVLRKDNLSAKERKALTKTSIERFTRAPALIIVCLTMEEMHKYPDRQRQKLEYVMAVQSVAAAIENMLLAARAERLGSCWFCAPLFCQDVVRKVLGIPKHVDPQALITLGYPTSKPLPPPRKNLENLVYQNRWGEII